MELTREKVLKSRRKREVKALYTAAFPKEERMPFALMLLMSCLWNTDFFAFYEGDTLCGIVYTASLGQVTFILFFAVAEELRSKGYGSCIAKQLAAIYPNQKRIVSIEPCVEGAENRAERIRRKAFYAKNGFVETGYFMKLAGQEQEILIQNGSFDKRELALFFWRYSNFTMKPKIWKKGP